MMYAVNVFASVYLAASVILSGELWRVTEFIQHHPSILLNIAAFSIASAIGQVHVKPSILELLSYHFLLLSSS